MAQGVMCVVSDARRDRRTGGDFIRLSTVRAHCRAGLSNRPNSWEHMEPYKLTTKEDKDRIKQGETEAQPKIVVRNKLARTPPKASPKWTESVRSASTEITNIDAEYVDLTDEEGKCKKQKPKMMDKLLTTHQITPKRRRETESPLDELSEIVRILAESSNVLSQLIKDNTNTKVEIKNEVKALARKMQALDRKVKDMTSAGTSQKRSPSKKVLVTQTEGPKTTTAGTQVNPEIMAVDYEREALKCEEKLKEVMEQAKTDPSFGTFKEVLDREWPNSIYVNTKTKITHPVNTELSALALVIDPDIDVSSKAIRKLIEKFPEIGTVLTEGITEGQTEYVEYKTGTLTSKSGRETRTEKYIYIVPYKIDENGINDIEKLHSLIVKLQHQMINKNIKVAEIAALGNLNRDYLRKCCEVACRQTGMEVTILLRGKDITRDKTNKTRKTPAVEKIIIKSGGESYADLLKKIKEKTNIGEEEGIVRAIKRVRGNDVMLVLNGDREKAELVSKAIKDGANLQATYRKNEVIMHVTDIDTTMKEEEIKEGIKKHLTSLNDVDVKIMSIRPTKDGNQTATLAVTKEAAKTLEGIGRVKIGWVNCRIRRRLNMQRCYRCLEVGHLRKGCNKPDRSEHCLKCGKPGHKQKDCQEQEFCVACEKPGHRADQTKCPAFRKMLQVEQRKLATEAKKPGSKRLQ